MALIQDIITDELAQFSLSITPSLLGRALVDAGIEEENAGSPYEASDKAKVDTAILSIVVKLLATPDVTEGGMSLKWDRAKVAEYANTLRDGLGILNTDAPVVFDRSNLW